MLQVIKNLYKANALLVAIVITICIAGLSLFNVNDVKPKIDLTYGDKYEHFVAYFSLTISWFFAVQKSNRLVAYKFWLVIIICSYGALMEFLQLFLTDYRMADFYDVLANSVGVVSGLMFYEKLIRPEFKEFLAT